MDQDIASSLSAFFLADHCAYVTEAIAQQQPWHCCQATTAVVGHAITQQHRQCHHHASSFTELD